MRTDKIRHKWLRATYGNGAFNKAPAKLKHSLDDLNNFLDDIAKTFAIKKDENSKKR